MKGSGIFVAFVFSALVAGCSGGGGGGGCFMAGQACSFPTQCCGGLTCDTNSKTCASTGNMCANSGQSCASMSCCQGLTCDGTKTCTGGNQCAASGQSCANATCCMGLSCMNGTCQQQQLCASTGQSCANATCCQGLQCSNGTCMGQDTRKAFGQGPCSQQTDCMTNVCITITNYPTEGECSAGCNASTQCAALSANPAYWCVKGSSSNFCLRQCTKTSDCSDIGADWSCDVGVDTENLNHGLCAIYKNLAEGQPCTDASQCAGGACNGSWCAATQPGCGSDAACGTLAACLQNQNNANSCFPKCTSDSDCAIFQVLTGLNYTCKSATTVNQASVMVCSG